MATAGNVKAIVDDANFLHELNNAGDKLVVIDFHATWCGPCKRIAPVFTQLSVKYSQAVFLKVDVDQCKDTAEKYSVTSMPTFIFIKSKVKVKELKGADPINLQELVKKYVGVSGEGDANEDVEVPGYSDLAPFFNSSGCNCLNESDENTHLNALKKGGGYLESDCDEQLMLTISFNQAVKIHSLKIQAPDDGRGPKTIKIFANQPNAVDFDQGERMEALQKVILDGTDLDGEKLIPLRFVKFQNVTNLVIFIVDNQGGNDVTVINYMKLIGCPIIATNMNEFKRVAGKAGESH